MKNDVIVNATFASVKRLKNSVNGNPRYRVSVIDASSGKNIGTYATASDAACAYDVVNIFSRRRAVTLIINGRGVISFIKD